jgi:hypothetical protein
MGKYDQEGNRSHDPRHDIDQSSNPAAAAAKVASQDRGHELQQLAQLLKQYNKDLHNEQLRFGLSMFIRTVVKSWNGPMLLGYLEKEIGSDGLRDILKMAGKEGLGGFPKGK